MSSHRPPTLAETLYDERLTNDQRLQISRIVDNGRLNDAINIKSARITGNSLFVWLNNGNSYRIDPPGTIWKLG